MKIVPAKPAHSPTAKEFHARRCFLLGIDPAKWGRLWAEERRRIEAARTAADGPRHRQNRRRRADS